jgi:hypothetical protein
MYDGDSETTGVNDTTGGAGFEGARENGVGLSLFAGGCGVIALEIRRARSVATVALLVGAGAGVALAKLSGGAKVFFTFEKREVTSA